VFGPESRAGVRRPAFLGRGFGGWVRCYDRDGRRVPERDLGGGTVQYLGHGVAAGDGLWDPPTYSHGGVRWHFPYLGWRGAYIAGNFAGTTAPARIFARSPRCN